MRIIKSISITAAAVFALSILFLSTASAAEADNWVVPAKMSGVTNGAVFSGDVLSLGASNDKKKVPNSSLANSKAIYKSNTITFKVTPETLGTDTVDTDNVPYMCVMLREKNIDSGGVIWDNRCAGYLVGIKAGWFEVRRFLNVVDGQGATPVAIGGSVAFFPNNGLVADGKTSLVEITLTNNADSSVNLKLVVEGTTVCDLKDSAIESNNSTPVLSNGYAQIASFAGFKGTVNFNLTAVASTPANTASSQPAATGKTTFTPVTSTKSTNAGAASNGSATSSVASAGSAGTSSVADTASEVDAMSSSAANSTEPTQTTSSGFNPLVIIIPIVLVVLIAGGIIYFFIVRKKK